MKQYDGYDEIEFKEVERNRKVRKKKHYLARFFVIIGVLVGLVVFLASGFFAIDQIVVTGNHYYSDEEIVLMANAKTGGNLFWGTGESAIKGRLDNDPYFAQVSIGRKLPSTLVIEVKERIQVAAISYGDKYVVIDEEGTVLRKSSVNPKLTLLMGLTISKMNVGEQAAAEEETTLSSTLKMLAAMEDGDFFFKKIDVSRVVIKAYIYDTLIAKGTPKQMLGAIENGDLQKVINNLFKNETTRGTINLGDHNYMSFSPDF